MARKEVKPRDLIRLSVELLDPGPERRTYRDEEEYRSLVHSIAEVGMREPLQVYPTSNGRHTVRRGNTRLQAAVEAGLTEILCIVDDAPYTDADDVLEWLATKDQRVSVNDIDRASAWVEARRLNGWTQTQLANHLRLNQGHISRLESLVDDGVPQTLQDKVRCGAISSRLALLILALPRKKDRDDSIAAERLIQAKEEAPEVKKTVYEQEWELPARGKTPPGRIVFVGWKKKHNNAEIIAQLQWVIDQLAGPKLAVLEDEEAPEGEGPTTLPMSASA